MSIPIFETERLILKAPTLEDAPAGQKYFNDFEIIKQISGVPWPYPENGYLYHLENSIFPNQGTNEFHWGIFLKKEPSELIGMISIYTEKEENRGFWLARPFWRQGLMTEAIEPVTDYAFNELNIKQMTILNAKDNISSHRIKEKTGAKHIGVIHHEKKYYTDANDGTSSDKWLLTKEAWFNYRNKIKKD